MLLKLISKQEKNKFLDIAALLAISSKPLLWDGKKKEDITPKTDLDNISIEKNERELDFIAELRAEPYQSNKIVIVSLSGKINAANCDIEKRFIDKLKQFPLQKIDDQEVRLEAAVAILKNIIKDEKYSIPSTAKVMLFELFLLAFCDGNISGVEWGVLKEFQYHFQLEDYIFDDLLERAEVMSSEINKTISIILE